MNKRGGGNFSASDLKTDQFEKIGTRFLSTPPCQSELSVSTILARSSDATQSMPVEFTLLQLPLADSFNYLTGSWGKNLVTNITIKPIV